MSPISRCLVGAVGAVMAIVCALPAIERLSASPTGAAPLHHVNRAGKGDRLTVPVHTIAPAPAAVEILRERMRRRGLGEAPKLLEGCEPMFSPVAQPAMAHMPGRCMG
jgi:hypothetical protein